MIYTLTLNPAIDRELTVPALELDSVLRASHSRIDYGGKGFNVSRLIKNLGGESEAVGFVGGKPGEILRDGLNALGIPTDFIWVKGDTRTNVSIVTPSGGKYLKVNEPGPAISPQEQENLLEKIEHLACAGDWWVLAGSLPPGLSADFYARLLVTLNGSGARAILDASGEALRLGCQARPFLVKPNAEEAAALTGLPVANPPEITAAAGQIRAMGVENVVISLGITGAFLQTEHESILARSPEVREMNPIGAGDSMVGGLVWALAQGFTAQDALRWGVASGAATASLSGTEVGSLDLIARLRDQVTLESW